MSDVGAGPNSHVGADVGADVAVGAGVGVDVAVGDVDGAGADFEAGADGADVPG